MVLHLQAAVEKWTVFMVKLRSLELSLWVLEPESNVVDGMKD